MARLRSAYDGCVHNHGTHPLVDARHHSPKTLWSDGVLLRINIDARVVMRPFLHVGR